MTTREVVQGYFSSLKEKQGWESFLADDLVFTSLTSPAKRVVGKVAYLEATKRFYGMIAAFDLTRLVVEGNSACALTHYRLRPPQGARFESDVAELLTVRDGKIRSFDIYFDSAPFPK